MREAGRMAAVLALAAALLGAAPVAAEGGDFQAFGGREGLVRVVDDLWENLLADPRTRPFFAKANRRRITGQLVDQFCMLLEGPCAYTGGDMRTMHKRHRIAMAEFNALVEALQDAMDANGVPFRAQNRLLAKLAPMYRDIVTR